MEEQGALLFVSDRPGHIGEYHKKGWKWNDGYWGNTDVWVAKWDLQSGRVSGLVHLPEPVNTAGAERTPWLSNDGLHLYLSSNGSDGEGPLRVLRFTRPDRSSWDFWSGPEEIGIDGHFRWRRLGLLHSRRRDRLVLGFFSIGLYEVTAHWGWGCRFFPRDQFAGRIRCDGPSSGFY